eukprot:4953893-Prymnesium_polylepis.1
MSGEQVPWPFLSVYPPRTSRRRSSRSQKQPSLKLSSASAFIFERASHRAQAPEESIFSGSPSRLLRAKLRLVTLLFGSASQSSLIASSVKVPTPFATLQIAFWFKLIDVIWVDGSTFANAAVPSARISLLLRLSDVIWVDGRTSASLITAFISVALPVWVREFMARLSDFRCSLPARHDAIMSPEAILSLRPDRSIASTGLVPRSSSIGIA